MLRVKTPRSFRMCRFLLLILAAAAGPTLGIPAVPAEGSAAKPRAPDPSDIRSLWPASHRHPIMESIGPGIGFSIRHGDAALGPSVPEEWIVEARPGAAGVETTFRHPSGLTVVRRSHPYPVFEAIEWSIRIRNDGRDALPPITGLYSLDLRLGPDAEGLALVSGGGGSADSSFPPRNFALRRVTLGSLEAGKELASLGATGGVSSRPDLPFCFLVDEGRSAGIFIALGWTGSWRASIRGEEGRRLAVTAGVPDLRIRLDPGEEIAGPTVLLGSWRGDISAGSNRLRRLLRDRLAPRLAGRQLPVVLYDTWFHIGCEFDEKLLRRLADRAAEMGQEVFLLDAGWYAGTGSAPYSDMSATWRSISRSLGNWDREEPAKFPSGLRAFAEYIRLKGLAMGLWFEPERIGRGSAIETAHPDWVLWARERPWGLVDFGRPEVQEWCIDLLSRYVRDLDLAYIRWDFNTEDALEKWEARDPPDRRGISQIRHLDGVHRVEDAVRERFPALIIESCAGGGGRIDLDTIRRRHTFWISDQTTEGHHVRFHLEGLNLFLPGSVQMVAFAPASSIDPSAIPDLVFQSHFGGAFGTAGRIHEWPPALCDRARRHVEVFKGIRRFLSADYYLLLPQPRDLAG